MHSRAFLVASILLILSVTILAHRFNATKMVCGVVDSELVCYDLNLSQIQFEEPSECFTSETSGITRCSRYFGNEEEDDTIPLSDSDDYFLAPPT